MNLVEDGILQRYGKELSIPKRNTTLSVLQICLFSMTTYITFCAQFLEALAFSSSFACDFLALYLVSSVYSSCGYLSLFTGMSLPRIVRHDPCSKKGCSSGSTKGMRANQFPQRFNKDDVFEIHVIQQQLYITTQLWKHHLQVKQTPLNPKHANVDWRKKKSRQDYIGFDSNKLVNSANSVESIHFKLQGHSGT